MGQECAKVGGLRANPTLADCRPRPTQPRPTSVELGGQGGPTSAELRIRGVIGRIWPTRSGPQRVRNLGILGRCRDRAARRCVGGQLPHENVEALEEDGRRRDFAGVPGGGDDRAEAEAQAAEFAAVCGEEVLRRSEGSLHVYFVFGHGGWAGPLRLLSPAQQNRGMRHEPVLSATHKLAYMPDPEAAWRRKEEDSQGEGEPSARGEEASPARPGGRRGER